MSTCIHFLFYQYLQTFEIQSKIASPKFIAKVFIRDFVDCVIQFASLLTIQDKRMHFMFIAIYTYIYIMHVN